MIVRQVLAVPDYNDSFMKYGIGGNEYWLRFSWNDTEERWYFGVYDALRNPIFQGVKVVPGIALNQFCGIDEMYQGAFAVLTDEPIVGRKDFVNGKARFCYAYSVGDS